MWKYASSRWLSVSSTKVSEVYLLSCWLFFLLSVSFASALCKIKEIRAFGSPDLWITAELSKLSINILIYWINWVKNVADNGEWWGCLMTKVVEAGDANGCCRGLVEWGRGWPWAGGLKVGGEREDGRVRVEWRQPRRVRTWPTICHVLPPRHQQTSLLLSHFLYFASLLSLFSDLIDLIKTLPLRLEIKTIYKCECDGENLSLKMVLGSCGAGDSCACRVLPPLYSPPPHSPSPPPPTHPTPASLFLRLDSEGRLACSSPHRPARDKYSYRDARPTPGGGWKNIYKK